MGDLVIAIVAKEPENSVHLAELIDRAQRVGKDIPDVKVHMANKGAAETIRFFLENGELPTEEAPQDETPFPQVGRFRKKPIEISAVQLSWRTWNDVCDFLGDSLKDEPGYNIPLEEVSDTCGEEGPEFCAVNVRTTHGELAVVRHGDWIIPDSKPGTFYPCKPDVFAATYEPVKE